jgi:hypothetical protein
VRCPRADKGATTCYASEQGCELSVLFAVTSDWTAATACSRRFQLL